MGDFKENIMFLSNEELSEKLEKLKAVYGESKSVLLHTKIKEEQIKSNPEYEEAVERTETENVREQYMEIYQYIDSLIKSPWIQYKYNKGSRGFGKDLNSLYSKLRTDIE